MSSIMMRKYQYVTVRSALDKTAIDSSDAYPEKVDAYQQQ